jgi:hypothetical protein
LKDNIKRYIIKYAIFLTLPLVLVEFLTLLSGGESSNLLTSLLLSGALLIFPTYICIALLINKLIRDRKDFNDKISKALIKFQVFIIACSIGYLLNAFNTFINQQYLYTAWQFLICLFGIDLLISIYKDYDYFVEVRTREYLDKYLTVSSLIQHKTKSGIWSYDITNDTIEWLGEGMYNIYEIDKNSNSELSLDLLRSHVISDLDAYDNIVVNMIKTNTFDSFNYTIKVKSGVKYLRCDAVPSYKNNKLVEIYGSVTDITESIINNRFHDAKLLEMESNLLKYMTQEKIEQMKNKYT